MCPILSSLCDVTQHSSVCSASCSVQCANEAPPIQDMCGLPSFMQEEENLQKGHVQLKTKSSLFPSLLPGGGFWLRCQQCVVSVLSVALFMRCACFFLLLMHFTFCCRGSIQPEAYQPHALRTSGSTAIEKGFRFL